MKYISIILFLLVYTQVSALSNYFDSGTSTGYWEIPSYWSLGHVPTQTEDVYIKDGSSCIVRFNSFCRSIWMEDNSYLLVQANTLTIDGTGGLQHGLNINTDARFNNGSTLIIKNIADQSFGISVFSDGHPLDPKGFRNYAGTIELDNIKKPIYVAPVGIFSNEATLNINDNRHTGIINDGTFLNESIINLAITGNNISSQYNYINNYGIFDNKANGIINMDFTLANSTGNLISVGVNQTFGENGFTNNGDINFNNIPTQPGSKTLAPVRGSFINYGKLTFTGSGTVSQCIWYDHISNTFNNYGEVCFDDVAFGGLAFGSFVNHPSGIIKGNAIVSTLYLTNNGFISPGCSPGKITFSDAYAYPVNYEAEIAGTAGPGVVGGYDQVEFLQNISLSGSLNVSLENGFIPTTGDSFILLEFPNGYTGAFDNVTVPNGASGNWQLEYTPNSITISALRNVLDPVPYLGIGNEDPRSALQVSDGDVYIETIGSGIIMKDNLGDCYKLTIDINGNITTTLLSNCPN